MAKAKVAAAKPKKSPTSFLNRLNTTLTTLESDTIRMGFSKIDKWVSLGNYALNRLMSGRFDRGFLFGRNYVLYGESGSGKSLLAARVAAQAQREHNAVVIWLDIERATDDEAGKRWLQNAGIDLDRCLYMSMPGLEDIKKIIVNACKEFRKAGEEEGIEPDPIVIVIDSWAAAQTKSAMETDIKGEMKGDQGQKAKQTGDLILSVTHLCSGIPVMAIGIQHVMDNQDPYGEKHKTTGGHKMIYYASGCLILTKGKLYAAETEDKEVVDHYKKIDATMTAELLKKYGKNGRTLGITCTAGVLKSRVSKPFEKIEIQVPYLTGIDPYSGLSDVLMQEGIIRKGGSGWYSYTDGTEEKKFQMSSFRDHADRLMQLVDQDISDSRPVETIAEIEEETVDESA